MISGSLQKKNGKWYTVIYAKDRENNRAQKWETTGLPIKGNKKEAEKILRERILHYEALEGCVRDDVLLSEFIPLWLESIKKKVEPNTYDGYRHYCENHIVPYFRNLNLKVNSATFEDIQKFLDHKIESGRLDGTGGLSVKTVREFKNILSSVFSLAKKKRIIRENPCELVELPKPSKKKQNFYTSEQAMDLLKKIRCENIYPIIYITLVYGLRRSEVLGIKWDSVDFDRRLVTIQHTVVDYDDVYEKDKTKTDASFRTYPMTNDVYELFLKAKISEKNNRKLFGKEYTENDYVFKWEDGHTYSPDYITARFRKLLKKYDLPHIRFHDLRHSCASILINNGYELKDISDWLGHGSIQITADYYGHLAMERKNKIANAMSLSVSA